MHHLQLASRLIDGLLARPTATTLNVLVLERSIRATWTQVLTHLLALRVGVTKASCTCTAVRTSPTVSSLVEIGVALLGLPLPHVTLRGRILLLIKVRKETALARPGSGVALLLMAFVSPSIVLFSITALHGHGACRPLLDIDSSMLEIGSLLGLAVADMLHRRHLAYIVHRVISRSSCLGRATSI